MEDKTVNEKILDLECVQFFFIFDYFHGNYLFSFGDQ
jgi:hypothetical protein